MENKLRQNLRLVSEIMLVQQKGSRSKSVIGKINDVNSPDDTKEIEEFYLAQYYHTLSLYLPIGIKWQPSKSKLSFGTGLFIQNVFENKSKQIYDPILAAGYVSYDISDPLFVQYMIDADPIITYPTTIKPYFLGVEFEIGYDVYKNFSLLIKSRNSFQAKTQWPMKFNDFAISLNYSLPKFWKKAPLAPNL
jgi:hypothetical protein